MTSDRQIQLHLAGIQSLFHQNITTLKCSTFQLALYPGSSIEKRGGLGFLVEESGYEATFNNN